MRNVEILTKHVQYKLLLVAGALRPLRGGAAGRAEHPALPNVTAASLGLLAVLLPLLLWYPRFNLRIEVD